MLLNVDPIHYSAKVSYHEALGSGCPCCWLRQPLHASASLSCPPETTGWASLSVCTQHPDHLHTENNMQRICNITEQLEARKGQQKNKKNITCTFSIMTENSLSVQSLASRYWQWPGNVKNLLSKVLKWDWPTTKHSPTDRKQRHTTRNYQPRTIFISKTCKSVH